MSHAHSACPLDCPDLCSLDVTVDAGRVTTVTGGQRSPITNGFICGKVRDLPKHMYGDARLRTPMVRDGGKHTPLRPASWDEALDRVVTRLTEIKARAGGEAIVPYHYGGSNGWLTEGALASRFFRRLGASSIERTLCAAATTAASLGMYGQMPGVALEDYVHAELIVLWGVNPSATGIHLVPFIETAMARGAKLIVVDPRATPLARRATLHLPVKPGADLQVALAMINEVFARGAADAPFLAAHARGVDELRARAAPWSLARAAAEAGVAVDALAQFADLYLAASPAVIRLGWGLERNRNGGSAVAAVMALPAIAGKFGVRAGGFTMSNSTARWGVGPEAAIGEPLPPTRRLNMSALAHDLASLTAPRIEALFVYNCNPLATVPNQAELVRQFARDDLFVVVHEQVMTDSAAAADVVLPATVFLEHRELRRGYGTMRMYDSPAVVAPYGEARSNNALFGELIERMNLACPGDITDEQALVDAIFASHPSGAALAAQLREHGVAEPASGPRPILFVDVFPATPDGKIDLCPAALDAEATGGLYHAKPDPATEAFPLALISPALSTQISSTFGQLRTAPALVDVHPDDAAPRGIRDGAPVRLWNALGEVHAIAHVTRHLRPGVLCMAKGYWRRHTSNGLTANALIPETFADLGGQAAFNDARVQIAPTGTGSTP